MLKAWKLSQANEYHQEKVLVAPVMYITHSHTSLVPTLLDMQGSTLSNLVHSKL